MAPDKKISIVTASFNIEGYIEQTISSVVGAKFGALEYILVDGGSTDGTMSIVEKHRQSIDVILSEPDDGQYSAIAKGFDLSSGDVMAWINADDILMPWTISVVREIFDRFPDVDWITGLPSFLNKDGQLVHIQGSLASYPRAYIANGWYQENVGSYLQQESMFWRRSLWEKSGGLDLRYRLAGDFDLWTRFAQFADLVPVAIPLAAFRERPGEQRSSLDALAYCAEVAEICKGRKQVPWMWRQFANGGLIARSLARLFLWHRGSAIIYDRRRSRWAKIVRWRSISRITSDNMFDQWLLMRTRA